MPKVSSTEYVLYTYKGHHEVVMKMLPVLITFMFFVLPACTDLEEQITDQELSNREITFTPELSISTITESGKRHLIWTSVENADSYIVHRDISYSFSSPELLYMGPNNSIIITPSPDGLRRYYRVMAKNQYNSGAWSGIIND